MSRKQRHMAAKRKEVLFVMFLLMVTLMVGFAGSGFKPSMLGYVAADLPSIAQKELPTETLTAAAFEGQASIEEGRAMLAGVSLEQSPARIGEPVHWTQRVRIKSTSANPDTVSVRLGLPRNSTGNGLQAAAQANTVRLQAMVLPNEETELTTTFTTEAPQKTEAENRTTEIITKRVIVSSSATIHYENVTAWTTVADTKATQIKIYVIENESRIDITANPRYNVSFVDENDNGLVDKVLWTVPQLSEAVFDVEVTLEVLNVFSHPVLGGNWTINFVTTGTANLSITATQNANYTNETTRWAPDAAGPPYDLQFLSLRCGGELVEVSWVRANCAQSECSIIVPDYTCNSTSELTAKELLARKHVLRFNFGAETAYAFNDVDGLGIVFSEPTIANQTNTINSTIPINITVWNASTLHEFTWNWNGTNYTFYNDLQLMYNFDNLTELGENDLLFVDASQKGNNGTGTGTNWTSSGKHNGALLLDGLGYVDIGTDSSLSLDAASFTIELWALWNQSDDGGQYGSAMLALGGFENKFIVAAGPATADDMDKVVVVVNGKQYEDIGSDLNDSTWHHILVTNDTGVLKVYVDGVSKVYVEGSTPGFTTAVNNIGREAINFANFNGSIDEFRIYNRSMNASEVSQHYRSNLKKTDVQSYNFYSTQSPLVDQTYSFFGAVEDTLGNANSTGTQNVVVSNGLGIEFVPPTIDDATITTNTSFPVNVSVMNASDIKKFVWTWNGANYTIYDDSLLLMMNFDNLSDIDGPYPLVGDASKYNHTARQLGAALSNVSGKFDRGLRLDGDVGSYLQWNPADTSAMNISDVSNFTISLWALWNQSEDYGTYGSAMLTLGAFANKFLIGAGKLSTDDQDKVVVVVDGREYNDVGSGLNDSAWHHILVTNDTGVLKVYIDGVSKAYVDAGVPGFTFTANRVGSEGNINFVNFNGTLDELRIYNRSMNSSEVQQMYWTNLAKMDIDRYLFVAEPTELDDQVYPYSLTAKDGSTSVNSGVQTTTVSSAISTVSLTFVDPTIANSTNTTNTTFPINISIVNATKIKSFDWKWNNTNYTLYDDSLLLMMNFDNQTEVGERMPFFVDASKYNHTARQFGNAVSNVSGRFDRALTLDGEVGSYLQWTPADTPAMNITDVNNFTISLWARWNQSEDYGTYGSAMLTLGAFANKFLIGAGKLSTDDQDKVVVVINGNEYNSIGRGLNDSNWHHILVTKDADPLRVYIDGASNAYVDAGVPGFTFTVNSVGSEGNINFVNFNGSLDELRIYNRSMNDTEAQQMYWTNLKRTAPDKFLFYAEPKDLEDQQYLYSVEMRSRSPTSIAGVSAGRNTIISNVPGISFVSPTMLNNTNTTNSSETVNVSIVNASDIKHLNWTWGATTYSVYDDSLLLMMNFDNVSGIDDMYPYFGDVSKYNNSPKAYGGVQTNASGRYDRGLVLDGDAGSYLAWNTKDIPALNITDVGAFTISLWAKWEPFDDFGSYGSAMLAFGGFPNKFIVGTGPSASGFNDRVTVVVNGEHYYNISEGLSDNTWHHILVTNDTGVLKVYIDGVSTPWTDAGYPGFTTSINSIGREAINFVNFKGSLDELRIYNRSMSSSEVGQVYKMNLKKTASDRWLLRSDTNILNGATKYGAAIADTSVYPNVNTTGLRNISSLPATAFGVNVLHPSNNSAGNGNFTFNVTGKNTSYHCNLYVNDTLYGENASVLNNTNTVITANDSLVQNSSYLWYLECTNAPTFAYTGRRNVRIDKVTPGVAFADPTPLNNSATVNSSYSINVSLTKNASVCTLSIDDGIAALGTGADGALTVSSANTVVNTYTYLTSDASVASPTLSVNSASGLVAGDSVLLHQTVNASGTAGEYEFATILSVSGSTLTLTAAPGRNYQTAGGSVTQVVRVPQYTSVVVNGGASIVPSAWNGATGGIVALKSLGTVTVDGSISTVGYAYAGGAGSGGCSGQCPLPGGYAGQGPDAGAGSGCAGDGGSGGNSGNENQSKLGSGGGGSMCNSVGGSGSGVIFVNGQTVAVGGSITANGGAGMDGTWSVGNAYAAGGGGAGVITITGSTLTLGSSKVTASGGAGGYDAYNAHYAPSGAAGRIKLVYASSTGSTSPASSNFSFASGPSAYNMTIVNNDGLTSANATVNNLVSGIAYHYNVTCADVAGNINMTGTRTLSDSAGDLTAPDIAFVTPTPPNGSITADDSTLLNVTVVEAGGLENLTIVFNSSEIVAYNKSTVLVFNFDNVSARGENATVTLDATNYSNNGSVSGATVNVTGKYSGAFTFDGSNDLINVPSVAQGDTLDLGAAGTIEAWIAPAGDQFNAAGVVTKRQKDNDLNIDYGFGYEDSSSQKLSCTLGNNAGSFNYAVGTNAVATSGVWYHIACTWNSTNMSIYLNGALEATGGVSLAPTFTANNLTIGLNPAEVPRYFNGTIDEVRVLNRTISAIDARNHYLSNVRRTSSSDWQYQINRTGLGVMKYHYNATAGDIAGNTASTSTQRLIVGSSVAMTILDGGIDFGTKQPGLTTDSELIGSFINVSNIGASLINISAYANASIFATPTRNANALPNAFFLIHSNTTASGWANTTYASIPAFGSDHVLVSGLNNTQFWNTTRIGIRLVVPDDEPVANRSSTLTFVATAT